MPASDLQLLADLAAEQWGLVTTAQARRYDVGARRLADLHRTGHLERLLHGVYRIAGSPSPVDTDLRAAWLAIDPGQLAAARLASPEPGVVSHRSAAALHQLGDIDANTHEFTVPTRKQSRRRDTRFHTSRLTTGDWTLVDGLPTTTVLTTIGDLTAGHLDGGHLAAVVRDAVVTHHADLHDVAQVLAPHAHRYGVPPNAGQLLLEQFLDEAGLPTATVEVARILNRHHTEQTEVALRHLNSVLQPLFDALAQSVAATLAAADLSRPVAAAVQASFPPGLLGAGPTLPDLQLPYAADHIRALTDSLAAIASAPALTAGPSLADLQLPDPAAHIRDLLRDLTAARDITIPTTLSTGRVRELTGGTASDAGNPARPR